MAGRATRNFFEWGRVKLPDRWRRYLEVQEEYVENMSYFSKKKNYNFLYKISPVHIRNILLIL